MGMTSRVRSAVKHIPVLHAWSLELRDLLGLAPLDAEFNVVPALCKPGTTVIDVGANVGVVTRALLQNASHVIAVEPIPSLAKVLRIRFRRELATHRLEIESCVLSDRVGVMELFVPHAASGLATIEDDARGDRAAGEIMRVPSRLLDEFSAGPVSFVKIDVEGHECSVVRGGLKLIARDLPALLIESEERHCADSLNQLTSMLLPLKYHGYFIMDGKLHPLGSFQAKVHQNCSALNRAGTTRLSHRTYVNNFFFVHSEDSMLKAATSKLGPSRQR